MLLLRDEKRLRYIIIKDDAPMQEMGYDVPISCTLVLQHDGTKTRRPAGGA